ncbi:Nodulin-related protein 2 [Linum perenne]
MDGLLSSITKTTGVGGEKEEHPPATTPAPTPTSADHKKEDQVAPSTAEMMASAKVVAEAAQSAMQSKSADNLDKAKVADAAEDLIAAGNKYGKLDEKGYGQYVDKAEVYLRQYSGPKSSDDGKPAAVPEGAGKPAAVPEAAEKPAEEGKSEGGGIGGYAKMAEGLFKK